MLWNNFDDLDKIPDEKYYWHVLRYMPFSTLMSSRLQYEYDKEAKDNAYDQ